MENEKREDKIVDEALKRFKLGQEAVSKFQRESNDDLKYVADDQWDPAARQSREQSGRPCLTDDRISPALRQITNEARQNIPSIQVNPMGDGADEDTAKVLQGLTRHIEYESNAESAYDKALWYAAAAGEGFIRLISEYEAEDSFDQRLLIKVVADPSTVIIDPSSVELDGSDMEWAFVIDTMTKDEFKRAYPDAEVTQQSDVIGWTSLNTKQPGWITSNTIRIAEYYWKEYENKTLYHLFNTVTQEEEKTLEKPLKESVDQGIIQILNKRQTEVVTVKWAKLNGSEILDEKVWPGKHIPIVPVKGEEFFVNGIKFKCGAIRRIKDSQKALNYTVSSQMEMIDMAPRAPYIAASGSLDTYEEDWRTMNQKNQPFLYYNQTDSDGNPAPPPERQAVETPIQAISATRQMAVDSIKSGFGIFEAAEGAQSNEVSGVAIIARTKQSNNSNYHFYDNLVKSVAQLGKMIIEVIPTFYDAPRMVRIVKPNEEQEMVAINMIGQNGKTVDFSVGKYDVMVKTGPSYASKRQEAVANGLNLIGIYPNAGPLIADLVMDNADGEGSKLISKRLRAAVPPEVLAATEETGDGQDPKQKAAMLQQQLTQSQEQLKALNSHAEAVEQQLKAEQMENKILKMKSDVEITKAELDKQLRNRELDIEEATTELEFLVKEQELDLAKREMALKEAQLAVAGVKAMSDMDHKTMSLHERRNDRESSKDKVTPREVMEDPDLGDIPTESLSDIGKGDLDEGLGESLGGKFS